MFFFTLHLSMLILSSHGHSSGCQLMRLKKIEAGKRPLHLLRPPCCSCCTTAAVGCCARRPARISSLASACWLRRAPAHGEAMRTLWLVILPPDLRTFPGPKRHPRRIRRTPHQAVGAVAAAAGAAVGANRPLGRRWRGDRRSRPSPPCTPTSRLPSSRPSPPKGCTRCP